ncbi:CsbD family protein [Weissella koreensis]
MDENSFIQLEEESIMALDDKLDGMKDQVTGKVKDVAGKVTGDHKTEAEGMAEELMGKTEEKWEVVKDNASQMPIMTSIIVAAAVAAVTTAVLVHHKKN